MVATFRKLARLIPGLTLIVMLVLQFVGAGAAHAAPLHGKKHPTPANPNNCFWVTQASGSGTLKVNGNSEGNYTVALQYSTCNHSIWQGYGTMTVTGTNQACANGSFDVNLFANKVPVTGSSIGPSSIGNPSSGSCSFGTEITGVSGNYNDSGGFTMCAELQNVKWISSDPNIHAGSDCP